MAHKGFPRQQEVVKAINEICGFPRDGNELNYRQKEDFLEFIRGESDNSPYESCTFRVTTLALQECAGYMCQELPEKLYIYVAGTSSEIIHVCGRNFLRNYTYMWQELPEKLYIYVAGTS